MIEKMRALIPLWYVRVASPDDMRRDLVAVHGRMGQVAQQGISLLGVLKDLPGFEPKHQNAYQAIKVGPSDVEESQEALLREVLRVENRTNDAPRIILLFLVGTEAPSVVIPPSLRAVTYPADFVTNTTLDQQMEHVNAFAHDVPPSPDVLDAEGALKFYANFCLDFLRSHSPSPDQQIEDAARLVGMSRVTARTALFSAARTAKKSVPDTISSQYLNRERFLPAMRKEIEDIRKVWTTVA